MLFWLGIAAQAALAFAVAKPWMTGDSGFYLGLAKSIDQGFYGWVQDGAVRPDALRPPGFPLILWLLMHRMNLSVAAVVVLQVSLYVTCILLIDRRLKREGLSRLPFRLLALIYPFGAIYCGFVMTEAWATIALTAVALLVTDRLTRPRLVIVGIIMGIAALIRGDLILLPLVIAAIVIARDWRSLSGAAIAGRAILPLLAAAIVVAPYALWNLRHFDRLSPIPVASAVGNSLYLATWQEELPLADLNALYRGVATPRVEHAGLASEMRRLNASIGADPTTSPFNPAAYRTSALQAKSSDVFGRAARERILAEPGRYLQHVGRNFWALWNTSTYPAGIPLGGRWGLALVSGLVFLAGLVGLLVSVRWKPRIAGAGLIMLYPMVVHLPLHTEARYTAAARPLLLMFASFAVLWLVKCYRERQQSRSGRGTSLG